MNFKPPAKTDGKRPPAKKRQPRKISADYLHNAGLYYLQRFAASRSHFETVMMRKVAKSMRAHPDQDAQKCAEMVQALADTFERSGLLNDETYSKAVVKSLRARGKSRRFISQKLRHSGVDEGLVTNNITQHDQDVYEQEGDLFSALIFARKKKIGPFKRDDTGDPQKIIAQMGRAGFSYDVLQKVLKMPHEDAENLLSRVGFR